MLCCTKEKKGGVLLRIAMLLGVLSGNKLYFSSLYGNLLRSSGLLFKDRAYLPQSPSKRNSRKQLSWQMPSFPTH